MAKFKHILCCKLDDQKHKVERFLAHRAQTPTLNFIGSEAAPGMPDYHAQIKFSVGVCAHIEISC